MRQGVASFFFSLKNRKKLIFYLLFENCFDTINKALKKALIYEVADTHGSVAEARSIGEFVMSQA